MGQKPLYVKLFFAVALIALVYAGVTLTREENSLEHGDKHYILDNDDPYLPQDPPSTAQVTMREKLSSVLNTVMTRAPHEAFDAMLEPEQKGIPKESFRSLVSEMVYVGTVEALSINHVPDVGPFARFGATVKDQASHLHVDLPTLSDRVFAVTDQDQDGQITWEEFITAAANVRTFIFQVVDANNDGKVTSDEAMPLLTEVLNALISLAMQLVDLGKAACLSSTDMVAGLLIPPGHPVSAEHLWDSVSSQDGFKAGLAFPWDKDSSYAETLLPEDKLRENLDAFDQAWLEQMQDADVPGLDLPRFITFSLRGIEKEWATDPAIVANILLLKQAFAAQSGGADAPQGRALRGLADEPASTPYVPALSEPELQFINALQAYIKDHKSELVSPVFSLLDRNRDMYISVHEYDNMMIDIVGPMYGVGGVTGEERMRVIFDGAFKFADADLDGLLTTDEVAGTLDELIKFMRREMIAVLNVVADVVVPELLPKALALIMSIADTDRDGTLSFEEFGVAMQLASQQMSM